MRREIIYIIKNQNTDKEKVQFVLNEVSKAGGITYANEKMNQYKNEALAILHEFPDNEIRQALEELVLFTTDRTF